MLPVVSCRRFARWSPVAAVIPKQACRQARNVLLTVLWGCCTAGLAACQIPTRPPGEWVRAVRVIDGDTLVLDDGRRVRLLGLDAPEMSGAGGEPECYAVEATVFLEVCLERTANRLRLETDRVQTDRFARTLAYLWDRNGLMLNESILREGYAVFYAGDALRWRDRLAAAEAEARAHRRGLWHSGACGDPSGNGSGAHPGDQPDIRVSVHARGICRVFRR